MSNALAIVSGDIYATRDTFESVLADRSINFDREAGFAVQILSGNDYALSIAMKNRQSVVSAVTNVAAIGLSLNPAKKHAYLVPRDGRICLDISYMGLIELAIASGSIRWAQAAVVHAADGFRLNGLDRPPTHEFNPFASDRGEPVGAYVVAKTADGDYLTETMSVAEINDIRDRSSAWKAWVEKKKKCPWVTDYCEMAKKTVIKRASKLWPKTDRLDAAAHLLNTDGGEGLAELASPPTDAPAEFVPAEWVIKARAATSKAGLKELWGKAAKLAASAGNKEGHAAVKAAVMERIAQLDSENQVAA